MVVAVSVVFSPRPAVLDHGLRVCDCAIRFQLDAAAAQGDDRVKAVRSELENVRAQMQHRLEELKAEHKCVVALPCIVTQAVLLWTRFFSLRFKNNRIANCCAHDQGATSTRCARSPSIGGGRSSGGG